MLNIYELANGKTGAILRLTRKKNKADSWKVRPFTQTQKYYPQIFITTER